MKITMEFARQDDCLDKMVPSDLRLLVGERDALVEAARATQKTLDEMLSDQNTYRFDGEYMEAMRDRLCDHDDALAALIGGEG